MKSSELQLVFATASPRRRVLAEKIKYITTGPREETLLLSRGIKKIVPVFMPVDVDEVTLSSAEETAVVNARLKGEKAAAFTASPILAFDTVVGTDSSVFGKPTAREQAVSMLKELCGRTHVVVTAVYFRVNEKIIEKTEKTYVTFGAFNKDLVYNYVDSGAPYDKAGGYNIDDPEVRSLVTKIDGDYDSVVGLPVLLTEKLIEENLIYGEDGHCY
ncbi:MAG: Maf family protein [Clostridiales bacterium]|nr:Maf family protein [Clostridiales bacterium]